MNPSDTSKAVALSEKVFQRLLAAYPQAHREEYGAAIAQLFRDQCRDAWSESRGWGLMKLWLRVLPDVVGTSFLEHLESIRERKFMLNRIGGLFRSAQTYKFFTVFTAVFLLVVITATVVTFILPEAFVGTARINLLREGGDTSELAGSRSSVFGGIDPYFIQTEFEVMQSQIVLGKVVEDPKLNLKEKWAAKFNGGEPLTTSKTIGLLKTFIDLRPIRNTSLVEIRAYSDRPDEAADLANLLTDAYRNYRIEKSHASIETNLVMLTERLARNEQELGIAIAKDDVLKLQTDTAIITAELGALNSYSGEELRRKIQGSHPDAVLDSLVKELAAAEQNLLGLQPGSSLDDAKKHINELKQKADDRVVSLIAGMEMRLHHHQALIAEQTNRLARVSQASINDNLRISKNPEQKIAELLQLRTALQMQITTEESTLKKSSVTAVEILDRASPNPIPARPNKPLNIIIGIMLGTVLGVLAGGGVAGISFWRRQTSPPKIAS